MRKRRPIHEKYRDLAFLTRELERVTEKGDEIATKVKRVIIGPLEGTVMHIITIHLLLERTLKELLLANAARPQHIDKIKTNLDQLAAIAGSQGLLEDRLVSALRDLHALRNKFAHRSDFELNDKQVTDFERHFHDLRPGPYVSGRIQAALCLLYWEVLEASRENDLRSQDQRRMTMAAP